ncbi:MAG TPA: hypothetical protein VF740_10515 [Candidatus Acidoferrum sp.]
MSRVHCEREAEIIEALRRGAGHPELAKHVADCAICADTLAVSEFLQADKTRAFVQHRPSTRSEEPWLGLNPSTVNEKAQVCAGLPDSDFLWWKAQLARKQVALERATRSIALVKKVSYLGAAAAGFWFIFAPGHVGSMLSVLSRHEVWPTGALTQSALFLGIAALVFSLLGSLYLARSEK